MTRIGRASLWLLSGLLFLFPSSGSAQSKTLNVDCNAPAGQLSTLGGALKLLDPSVPNTINVSGNCNENVVIQSFERLTLNAVNGASITDASNFNSAVVDFEDSKGYLNGFTISGGSPGVLCSDFSQCRLQNNTLDGGFPGMNIAGQAYATFSGDTIEHGGRGLLLTHNSFAFLVGLNVINNGNDGISVAFGSTVAGSAAINGNGGNGVNIVDHGTFQMTGGSITGNGKNGVILDGASEATFQSNSPVSISGNTRNGVQINNLSFARFQNNSTLTVTGNASNDVQCNGLYSATVGATTNIGGGSTNCPN